jgi:hypothetical protein
VNEQLTEIDEDEGQQDNAQSLCVQMFGSQLCHLRLNKSSWVTAWVYSKALLRLKLILWAS